MAKVTIAVPCHNEEEFLETTLRCLMAQTEREIEIIVCDNASTDRTPEIAEALAGDVAWTGKFAHCASVAEVSERVCNDVRGGDAILIKGSNSVGLSAVVEALLGGGD